MFRRKNVLVTFCLIVSVTLSVFFLTACGKSTTNSDEEIKQDKKVIKIGAILPLTGKLAFIGEPELNAIKIAIEKVNSISGSRIEFKAFFEDSKGESLPGVTAARKLIDIDKVDLIIASTTKVNEAIKPICVDKKIPLFTVASSFGITTDNPLGFRVYISFRQEQTVIAEYLKSKDFKKIGIVYVNDRTMNQAKDVLSKYLTEKEIRVTKLIDYELGVQDFNSILLPLNTTDVEAIVLEGYGLRYGQILKSLKELKIEKPVLGNYMFLTPVVQSIDAQFVSEIPFASFKVSLDSPKVQAFLETYKKKFNKKPGIFIDYLYIYDTINIIHGAYSEGISDGKSLSDYLRGRTFHGITGEIKILDSGDTDIEMEIKKYNKEKLLVSVWENK